MEQYKRFYRAAHDFHARWAPSPANGEEWDECAEDLCRVAQQHGNNPFLMDMLVAIHAELERAYEATKAG